jgi:DNA invertase Pin-like site-specific DNA recombinase
MKAGRPRKQRPWRPGAPAPIQAAGCGPERRLAVRQPNRPGSRLRLKHTPTGHAQDWLEIQHRRKKKGSAATVINDIQYLAGKQFQHLADIAAKADTVKSIDWSVPTVDRSFTYPIGVNQGRADFNCILVYDVSRWGRFQDVDESAYYELICKRAGIAIHYCEEEFENDGSLSSVILKSVSRVEAANFSRRLSKRIFMAQSHGVSLGFWRGGSAGYGYRRQAVDESGAPRGLLAPGEQKYFKSDHVILVPGPESEVDIVHRIFRDFVAGKKTRTEIANELNAQGTYNAQGNPWQMQSVSILLRNEVYLGHNIFNRRSFKLQQKPVKKPS